MAKLAQIKKVLERQRLDYKLVRLESPVFIIDAKAEAMGINKDEVVKTLIVRTNKDYVALALRGSDRVNFKKVRERFGNKSELAKPEEVLRSVKVPIGAVCPIGLEIALYLDKKVLEMDKVHMGSGDLMYGLEMKKDDFLKVIDGCEFVIFTD